MDELRPITEDDAVYELAAFAFHHADQMTRGVWVALLAAWPSRKGPRPNYYDANYAAQAVDRLGASLEDIAAVWVIELDSARKKISEGRKPFSWQSIARPAVVALTGEVAGGLLDVCPKQIDVVPGDPSRADAWNETLLPTDYDEIRSRDALIRATRATQRQPRASEEGRDQ